MSGDLNLAALKQSERMLGICERTLRVAEHPEGDCSVTQDCGPGIFE
jgi:hypothetical protein